MKLLKISILVGTLLLAAQSASLAETYTVDLTHSDVSFKVKHMVVSKVRGHFDTFEGEFQFTPDDPTSWKVEASIDATTINTGNDDRDNHLRSPDFFDVEQFSTITFVSKSAKAVEDDRYELTGDLTIHGITKQVTLDLEYQGSVQDPWGNERVGFSAGTKVNRKDFDLNWNKTLEAGGLVVGEKVEISIEIEGILKK